MQRLTETGYDIMNDTKKKILVVEDEKSISDIIKFNLEKEGFAVYTSYDGEDALVKQVTYDPDLICWMSCFRSSTDLRCVKK